MKKIYTFILTIGLLISASNTFAQCTLTPTVSTNVTMNEPNWPWGDCTVELCIDYQCTCSPNPGCLPGSTFSQICTTLDGTTSGINYYPITTTPCCTLSIAGVHITKTPVSGPSETTNMSSGDIINFQTLLSTNVTTRIECSFIGTIDKDCNNVPFTENNKPLKYFFYIKNDVGNDGVIELHKN